MHAIRSARPKLSLAVPVAAAQAPKPVVPTLIIPTISSSAAASRPAPLTPLTPTTRNTALNARLSHSSSLQVPTFATKKGKGKSVRFAEEEHVTLVSPCPREYYGDYVKMSREERRWARQ